MSDKRRSSKKHAAQGRHRLRRFFLFLSICVIAAATALFTVDADDLPAGWQKNMTVHKFYDGRRRAEDAFAGLTRGQTQDIEPAAGDTTKGYAQEDRAQLERLISKGAEDH